MNHFGGQFLVQQEQPGKDKKPGCVVTGSGGGGGIWTHDALKAALISLYIIKYKWGFCDCVPYFSLETFFFRNHFSGLLICNTSFCVLL